MQKKSTWGKTILLSICSFLLFSQLFAQSCNCAATIGLTTSLFDASSIQPGQTICLQAGVRTQNLRIVNINGTKSNRVVIKNCSGKVTFNIPLTFSYSLWIQSSTNFRVTGTGSGDAYGIEINGSHNGFQIGVLSSDFEIDHMEIRNCGFAGIMAKTDNSGRGSFVMKNVSFHDNYIHNTTGEGFYVGNTSWQVNGNQHDIDSLELFNNITDNTGCEGIQVGCTYSGNASIHNNIVTNPGQDPFANFQNNGIQLTNGYSGLCYNNYIANAPGNGLIVLGPGNIYVFNNIIVRPGDAGIYTGNATAETGKPFNYFHNTIIMGDSAERAIKFDPGTGKVGNFYNNAIQHLDTMFSHTISGNGTIHAGGNIIRSTNGSFKFEDPAAGNYDLLAGSDAINKGDAAVGTFNIPAIHFDYENRPRPVNQYDAGAYEFQGGSSGETTVLYRVNAGGLQVTDAPINWVKDKQNDACAYWDSTSAYFTTGSDNPWSGTNNTDAPSQIFSTIRFANADTGPRNNVHYKFPVINGSYQVNLYFAENTFTAAGQRVFDVSIEGAVKLDNFDIYATAGYRTAYKDSFIVSVNDGILDVNIIKGTGGAQINGIEIVTAEQSGARLISSGSLTQPVFNSQNNFVKNIKIYPVPLENRLYIERRVTGLTDNLREDVDVTLFNQMGTVLYRRKHRFSGGKMDPIDLSSVTLKPGIYFLGLSGAATNETFRLLKR